VLKPDPAATFLHNVHLINTGPESKPLSGRGGTAKGETAFFILCKEPVIISLLTLLRRIVR
jgi:hypothetical protein